jgi:3-hydroxybutyryl-CoA dehydrogenase
MKLVVLTDYILKEELLTTGIADGVSIEWIDNPTAFAEHKDADAFFDLLFVPDPQRIALLNQLTEKTVFINSQNPVNQKHFIRINALPTFLKRDIAEVAAGDEEIKTRAEEILAALNRKAQWVEDEPGFITARIIMMIINEAYFALGEGVSTKKEIDTAMKLGTNYPYGPFEWAEKIGLKNVYELLLNLSNKNHKYKPAEVLIKEMKEL